MSRIATRFLCFACLVFPAILTAGELRTLNEMDPANVTGSLVTNNLGTLTKTITDPLGNILTLDSNGIDTGILQTPSEAVWLNYTVTGLDYSSEGGTTNDSVSFTVEIEALTDDANGGLVVPRADQHFGVRSASNMAVSNLDDIFGSSSQSEGLSLRVINVVAPPNIAITNEFSFARFQGLGSGEQMDVTLGDGSTFTHAGPPNNYAPMSSEFSFRGALNTTGGDSRFAFQDFRLNFEANMAISNGDFNNDGEYDCTDVDALVAEIAGAASDLSFDLNSDGAVDSGDLSDWLAEAGAVNLSNGNPYLPGDANLDGFVDVGDFNVWNSNKFLSTPAWCSGDFNADGAVDVGDFNVWNSNKFLSSDDVATVPEPGSMSLILLGSMFLWRTRKRGQ